MEYCIVEKRQQRTDVKPKLKAHQMVLMEREGAKLLLHILELVHI